MNKQIIKDTALKNGFKLKEQPNGELDLNPYVYDFANELVKSQQQEIESLKAQLAQVKSTNHSLEEINADLSESLKLLKDKYQSDDWISVSDRLPEDGQDVIAITSIVSCQFVDNEFLEEFYEYDSGHSYQEATHVTHWKPMSQVIKQEQHND